MEPGCSLSILIATFRGPPSLDTLLDSLLLQKWLPGDEVVFIDNGGSSNHKARITAFFHRCEEHGLKPFYLREDKPGLTHARLAGFQQIHNEWIFLLDDDNSLAPDTISGLRKRLMENPNLGGICPRIDPVWAPTPPAWMQALGHDILSYNHSAFFQVRPDWIKWPARLKKRRPPGGGMIICRRAVENFISLVDARPEIETLGHLGAALGSGEDYLLYEQIYSLGLSTAYDASIQIFHHIPQYRLEVNYLFKLVYGANFGFARVAIMLKGKMLFPASIVHAAYRLVTRLLFFMKYSRHPFLFFATCYAFLGYLHGTLFQLTRRSD